MTKIPQTQQMYRLLPLPQCNSISSLGSLKSAPVPTIRPSQVLVKVHAVSLNFRDLMIAKGQYPAPTEPNGVIPTSDLAGEIIALGSDVSGWNIGDRVCSNFSVDWLEGDASLVTFTSSLGGGIDGGLQEYIALPAHALVSFPSHLTYEQAATLPCAAVTAYNALNTSHAPLKAGDTVLVQGTGGVSTFALQIAVAAGATVIATSSTAEKLEALKKLGAKHVINYREVPEWGKEVVKLTGGRGVDHVVEVGGPGTIEQSFEAVRFGGNVSTIGSVAEPQGGAQPNLALLCLMKAVVLRGVLIGSVKTFNALNRLIIGANLVPIVDKVFPFDQAPQAYRYLEDQKHIGKVVIKVSSD